jgi:tryptophan synthase alpha chain
VLLVDLPPEEAEQTRAAFAPQGLALIALAAPTTSPERLAMLCDSAQGYLYYVSFSGVTGASDRLDTRAAGLRLRELRQRAKVPVVAGFGIRDAARAAAMAVDADGVVVGSALVAVLEAAPPSEAAAQAGAFLRPLRQALDTVL